MPHRRNRKHATPEELVEKFHSRYVPVPEAGCWLWEASTTPSGYGQMHVHGKGPQRMHRFSWEIHKGPIPEGAFVCHRCDTPACVNPDHLFLGTAADNNADMWGKGRGPRNVGGGRSGMAKLTPEQVVAIRADPRTNRAVAADLGMNHAVIGAIRRREIWAHIPIAANDATRLGRRAGSRHGRAKLTEADIPAIRSDTRSSRAIARAYGVSRRCISLIKNGTNWAHIA